MRADADIALLAVYDGLSDWEPALVAAHLNTGAWRTDGSRHRIVTVALTPEPVVTMGGLRVVPDITIDDARPDAAAILILSGGSSWAAGANDAFVGLARTFLDADTPVAAICAAVEALARGGLLDERRHTGNDRGMLAATGYAGGAQYVDALAVTDAGVVTATGIAPVAFARAIYELLDVYPAEVLEPLDRLYRDADPSAYLDLFRAASTTP